MVETVQVSRKEMIETLLYPYVLDGNTRGVDEDGDCVFNTPEGNKCFIGKLLREEDSECDCTTALFDKYPDEPNALNLLQERYQGHPEDFYVECRAFHNTYYYWVDGVATEECKQAYQELLTKWSEN